MAGALAYFKIKVNSFSDWVFETIQFELLDKFHIECEKELRSKLGLHSDDNTKVQLLVAEASDLASRREKLEHDLDRQKKAMKLIHG